jgi:hypothetical protein
LIPFQFRQAVMALMSIGSGAPAKGSKPEVLMLTAPARWRIFRRARRKRGEKAK